MGLDIPSMPIDAALDDPNADEDLIPPDERRPMRLLDSRRQADGELSDSDDEGEGGRRDHAKFRESDSVEGSGSHKFGIGGGILTSGAASTHGAGPSGHTTVARMLSATTSTDMDVDSSSASASGDPAALGAVIAPSSERATVPSDEPASSTTDGALPSPANDRTTSKTDEKSDAAPANTEDKMSVD